MPSLEFPQREAFGVSAFHQLHCIVRINLRIGKNAVAKFLKRSLKHEIGRLVLGLNQSSQGRPIFIEDLHDAGHTAHCVNFLIQVSRGDDALESVLTYINEGSEVQWRLDTDSSQSH